MRLKRSRMLTLPPVIVVLAMVFAANRALAQTMGEYASTTAMSASGKPAADKIGAHTWETNPWGGSWRDRVGKGSGAGADFSSRADALTGRANSESRWPDTSVLDCPKESAKRFGSSDRFANDDNRFKREGDDSPRFGSESGRWSASRFHDNMGLDDRYNPIANY